MTKCIIAMEVKVLFNLSIDNIGCFTIGAQKKCNASLENVFGPLIES